MSRETKIVFWATILTFLSVGTFWGIWASFTGSVPSQEVIWLTKNEVPYWSSEIHRGWDMVTIPVLVLMGTTLFLLNRKVHNQDPFKIHFWYTFTALGLGTLLAVLVIKQSSLGLLPPFSLVLATFYLASVFLLKHADHLLWTAILLGILACSLVLSLIYGGPAGLFFGTLHWLIAGIILGTKKVILMLQEKPKQIRLSKEAA